MIDRDVLETMPDMPVRQGDDLGLSLLVDLGDRLEQRLGRQENSFVTNALPPGTEFVTETLTASVLVIEVSPGQGIGLITDPVADNRVGLQERIPDLLVDRVIRKEPAQIRCLQRNKLVIQVLEDPLGIESV
jgi:hypothetical protein